MSSLKKAVFKVKGGKDYEVQFNPETISLSKAADWAEKKKVSAWRDLGVDDLSAFLADQKGRALEASSLRIAVVHLKIFFRFLASRNLIDADPAEPLLSPRTGSHLPETLHENHVTRLLESIDPAKPPTGSRPG